MTPHMDIAPLKHACRKPTAKNIYAEPTKPTPPRPKPPQSKTQFKWYINRFRCKEIALLKCGRRPEWVPNTLVKSVCKSTVKQVFQTRPGTCQQSLWRGHRNQNLGRRQPLALSTPRRVRGRNRINDGLNWNRASQLQNEKGEAQRKL
jgi:hypothetical protein